MPILKESTTLKATKTSDLVERLAYRMRTGRVIPVISNFIVNTLMFNSLEDLAKIWADDIDYPLEDSHNLVEVARFASFGEDLIYAKRDYVDFLKAYLCHLVDYKMAETDLLTNLNKERGELTFSELYNALDYANLDKRHSNILRYLAALPVPLYITTSYHNLFMSALQQQGRYPRVEICRWHAGLTHIPSVLDDNYIPTINEPLVYHLYGLDKYPESMVFSDSDYINFLSIAKFTGRANDLLPRSVRSALASSSLIFLGYELLDLEFSILSYVMLSDMVMDSGDITSIFIQSDVGDAKNRFVSSYLAGMHLEGWYGSVENFLSSLINQL